MTVEYNQGYWAAGGGREGGARGGDGGWVGREEGGGGRRGVVQEWEGRDRWGEMACDVRYQRRRSIAFALF